MFVQILGSAAGGGFPQWNCNCVNCAGFREGTLRATARTQSSIAISDDGVNWVLCNTSPDIRAQLQSFAPMQPGRALRDTGISAIILMDSQIDHTTGLLSLRDGAPIHLYATPAVFEELTHTLPVLPLLQHYCSVHWHVIPVAGESREAVFRVEGQPTLEFTAVATDGPLPLHSARPAAPDRSRPIAPR